MSLKPLFLLCLSAALFFSAVPPKRGKVQIKSEIFRIYYSEILEQPLTVEYQVKCTEKKFSRAGMDFYTCDSVYTSDDRDYENNVWDKGHMAPAADFSCDRNLLWGTFSYLNCALQHERLNRGVWRILEEHERNLALKNQVSVKIVLHFSRHSLKLESGAVVPDGFTKTLSYSGMTETYYFPNSEPTKATFRDYLQK